MANSLVRKPKGGLTFYKILWLSLLTSQMCCALSLLKSKILPVSMDVHSGTPKTSKDVKEVTII